MRRAGTCSTVGGGEEQRGLQGAWGWAWPPHSAFCSPAVLRVTVLLWSLSWGSSEPLISDLSGHFCSLHEVRVNVGIKKGGSRGCAEAKNGTEFRERFHGCKQYFLIPEELTAVGRGPSSKGGNDGSTADPRGGLGQNLWLCADGKAPWMLLREGRRNF